MTSTNSRPGRAKATPEQKIERWTINGIAPTLSVVRSPSRIIIWRALGDGAALSFHDVFERFGIPRSSARKALEDLAANGKVHVSGWARRGSRGPYVAVYSFGPGCDVPAPKPIPNSVLTRRWRQKNQDRERQKARNVYASRAARAGRGPVGNDPLLFAIMGVKIGAGASA